MKAILEEKGVKNKIPVFGILERNGKVKAEIVKDVSAETLLRETIKKVKGFWSYAKERLLKFHGVNKDNFIYYLKELEFRYNFRDNIDDSLYKC